jgi:tetratricopeptide (TPR) repeat protein
VQVTLAFSAAGPGVGGGGGDAAAAVDAMLGDAAVPLASVHAALESLESAARDAGASLRSAHQARHLVARHVGDSGAAQREFELWVAAARDLWAGCRACEQGWTGDWHAERGADGRAFEAWDGLFGGRLFCGLQPHRVLAHALVPLVRLGRGEQARTQHLSGYSIVRLKPLMAAEVGAHLEFCALTGNAARGLELLAEHGDWLADHADTTRRVGFLGGVDVLLRVLGELGFDDVPFTARGETRELGSVREAVAEELVRVAGHFDARNGTTAFSERVVLRRSRQPFLSVLPLPARTALPAPRRRSATATAVGAGAGTGAGADVDVNVGADSPADAPAVAEAAQPPVQTPVSVPLTMQSVDELVAQARRLTAMWHPDAMAAWRRVQEAAARDSGVELSAEARVELDEQVLLASGDVGVRRDCDAAAAQHAGLLEISERYRALGKLGPALRAASRAAFALFRGGQVDVAASQQSALRLAAADALAGREITAREYMAVRIGSGYQRFNAWLAVVREGDEAGERGGGDAASPASSPERGEREAREALGELGELVEECRRFGVSLHGAAAAGMAAEIHLGRGEEERAEERLRQAVELYVEGGAPWSATSAELNLSQIARSRGDLAGSEQYARSAVEHNLDPELRGPAAMLLAEAIWLQDGREGEAVAPALAAAAAFARQPDGADDEARAQLRAAEALATVRRDEEAVALFEPALRVLDARWDEDDWKPVIAQAARAYGNSLMAVGDPRRAAELLLGTAERVKDWPNQVPHAMMAADAATALERAGRHAEAAAAFQRAADLWGGIGERMVRIKCLRSAAWLLAGEDLDAALGLMDRAGGELVHALATAEPDERTIVRYEIAETHVQRARVVLNLATDGLLPEGAGERLVEEAFQEIGGAVSGLRRLLGEGTPHAEDGGEDAAGGEALGRLVYATLVAGRLEGGHLGRAAAAVARLREVAQDCAGRGHAELAVPLVEYADELDRTRSAAAAESAEG